MKKRYQVAVVVAVSCLLTALFGACGFLESEARAIDVEAVEIKTRETCVTVVATRARVIKLAGELKVPSAELAEAFCRVPGVVARAVTAAERVDEVLPEPTEEHPVKAEVR